MRTPEATHSKVDITQCAMRIHFVVGPLLFFRYVTWPLTSSINRTARKATET